MKCNKSIHNHNKAIFHLGQCDSCYSNKVLDESVEAAGVQELEKVWNSNSKTFDSGGHLDYMDKETFMRVVYSILSVSLNELYEQCKHGDEEHQRWLREKFDNYLNQLA